MSRFRYAPTKDGRVMIHADGKLAKTLKGPAAERFLSRVAGASEADAQQAMAAATGQFKFGNERSGRPTE